MFRRGFMGLPLLARRLGHTLWQDIASEAPDSLEGWLHRHARPLAAHNELLHPKVTIPGYFGHTLRRTAKNKPPL
jgi:hypothetical protein